MIGYKWRYRVPWGIKICLGSLKVISWPLIPALSEVSLWLSWWTVYLDTSRLPLGLCMPEQTRSWNHQCLLAHLSGDTGSCKADDIHKAKLGKFLAFQSTPKGFQGLTSLLISYQVALLALWGRPHIHPRRARDWIQWEEPASMNILLNLLFLQND